MRYMDPLCKGSAQLWGIFMKGLMVSLSPVLDQRLHDETAGSLTLW